MDVVIAALSAPAQLNGVSRHAINLTRALLSEPRIGKVHVLAGKWQKDMFESLLNDLGTQLHMHWVSLVDANFARLSWYYRELPYIAAQLEADIVHLSYPAPIRENGFHCPTVLSIHDLYPFDLPENFGPLRSAVARRILGHCISRVDAIACVSASTRTRLAHWFPAQIQKSIVIPNGVDLHPSSASEQATKALKDRSFILCVAQHRCNKNLPLAIRTFERLLQNRTLPPDSRLVIVGIPGPETRNIQEQMRLSRLTGKVLLLGGLPDSDLRWCYENCSLLLAPSSLEGFGLPVAEGLLVGCRIVCSDIPAFREIGGESCQFVNWSSDLVESYAEVIRNTLMIPKPDGALLPQFSLGTISRKYLDLYETLICSRVPEFDMLRQPEVLTRGPDSVRSRSA